MTDQNNQNQYLWPENKAQHKSTNIPSIIVALILTFLLVTILGFYIYYGMNNTPAALEEVNENTEPVESAPLELTEEEKMRRLESLSQNPSALTEEEKIIRLQTIDTAVDIPLEDRLERLETIQ